jgi:hypothetical protein
VGRGGFGEQLVCLEYSAVVCLAARVGSFDDECLDSRGVELLLEGL